MYVSEATRLHTQVWEPCSVREGEAGVVTFLPWDRVATAHDGPLGNLARVPLPVAEFHLHPVAETNRTWRVVALFNSVGP